jgi:hypothetical protein
MVSSFPHSPFHETRQVCSRRKEYLQRDRKTGLQEKGSDGPPSFSNSISHRFIFIDNKPRPGLPGFDFLPLSLVPSTRPDRGFSHEGDWEYAYLTKPEKSRLPDSPALTDILKDQL